MLDFVVNVPLILRQKYTATSAVLPYNTSCSHIHTKYVYVKTGNNMKEFHTYIHLAFLDVPSPVISRMSTHWFFNRDLLNGSRNLDMCVFYVRRGPTKVKCTWLDSLCKWLLYNDDYWKWLVKWILFVTIILCIWLNFVDFYVE